MNCVLSERNLINLFFTFSTVFNSSKSTVFLNFEINVSIEKFSKSAFPLYIISAGSKSVNSKIFLIPSNVFPSDIVAALSDELTIHSLVIIRTCAVNLIPPILLNIKFNRLKYISFSSKTSKLI